MFSTRLRGARTFSRLAPLRLSSKHSMLNQKPTLNEESARSASKSEKFKSEESTALPASRPALRDPRPKIQINSLSDILVETIKTTGPLSLSAYMKTCLTHPEYGYYTSKDPLGVRSAGDFVTSPEISQMFGEMVGVWFYATHLAQSSQQSSLPLPLQFIEFGPGKGTLMYDLLRSFNRLYARLRAADPARIQVVLVEASPILRHQQFELLCGAGAPAMQASSDGIGYVAETRWGNIVRWVDTEKDIDELGHTGHANYVVCHEFFDALPIKQFEKTKDGWRECLVDYVVPQDKHKAPQHSRLSLPGQTIIRTSDIKEVTSPSEGSSSSETSSETSFHVTIAPKKTTAAYLPQNSPRHNRLPVGSRVEISPETLTYAKKIQEIVTSNRQRQGAALVVDYGPADTVPVNTFRGIRAHRIMSPFVAPGLVDLSADVDFQGIKVLMESTSAQDEAIAVDVHGPAEQGDWLNELGMAYRAQQLMDAAKSDEEKEKIKKSYLRLVEKGGSSMGKIYKFMGVVPRGAPQPVGFGGVVPE